MDISGISYDLLHKYNVQGPRYTSYPPAPSWSDTVGGADYEREVKASNMEASPAPLSLYFHLPFCEKLCYFCGCTTVITGKNRSMEDPYLDAVLSEVEWLGSRVDQTRPVIQLHLGGGTPTFFAPAQLERLLTHVRRFFHFSDDAEIGCEVDPRVTTEDHLSTLRRLGFNRLSMGVQDFDPQVQKSINREQSYEQTAALVRAARSLGYASVNMDLIYGLPYQTVASFEKTIERILDIGPDRLAVYSYAHVPWLKKHQDLLAANLPGEKEKFAIFIAALRGFTSAGFDYIGMDHFAKPEDELSLARRNRTLWRNFQGYTTKAGTDLLGMGMSAIGNAHQGFFQNDRDMRGYIQRMSQGGPATVRGFRLSLDDRIRSRVIQNLLCHAVVIKKEIEAAFGIPFDDYFRDALEKLKVPAADGLVELTADEIRPTTIGRVFLRNLAMPFDAYLPKDGDKKIFSRTV